MGNYIVILFTIFLIFNFNSFANANEGQQKLKNEYSNSTKESRKQWFNNLGSFDYWKGEAEYVNQQEKLNFNKKGIIAVSECVLAHLNGLLDIVDSNNITEIYYVTVQPKSNEFFDICIDKVDSNRQNIYKNK